MRKKLFSEIPFLKSERLTIRALASGDAASLQELMDNTVVYRYLPTFLFEKNNGSAEKVIDKLYTECWKKSMILGVFENGEFCGLAEMYGFKDQIHIISVGYRFLERCWGRRIATETLGIRTADHHGQVGPLKKQGNQGCSPADEMQQYGI